MSRHDSQRRFQKMPEVIPTPGNTALVVIDMQYLDAHPDFGIARKARDEGQFEILNHLFARLPSVIHNIRRVQQACRKAGIEVIFIKIQSYTLDGRDLSPSYKTKGLQCPPGSKEAQILEELQPVGDEIVIPKLSTNAFTFQPDRRGPSVYGDYQASGLRGKYELLCRDVHSRCLRPGL